MENEVKEPAFKYNYTSPAEYLAAERMLEEKHEYYDGQVLAMSGASLNHVRITRNITSGTNSFLSGKDCQILPTDMRVTTPTNEAYMYPDAVIVCGKPQLEDDNLTPYSTLQLFSKYCRHPHAVSIEEENSFFTGKFIRYKNI